MYVKKIDSLVWLETVYRAHNGLYWEYGDKGTNEMSYISLKDVEEVLLHLQEECMEVGHIANKAIRFSVTYTHPDKKVQNKDVIAQEVGHLLAMVELLERMGVINLDNVQAGKEEKFRKLKEWSSIPVDVIRELTEKFEAK